MNKNTLLLPGLLAPALLSLALPRATPANKIRFAPSDGSSVTKTFVNKAEFTLDEMSIKMNGQDSPMKPEMEMTITSEQKVVVTDEYVASREGMPKKLKRRFDELGNDVAMSMKMDMMGQSRNQDQTIKGESELQGKTVVFAWDEEKGEYTKSFEPKQEKEDLLKDLKEDMDLRALLPSEDKKEGESWEIDVKTLASVLAPGGNLAILPKEMGENKMAMGMPGMGSLSDWLGELLEGSAKGTYAGMREVDGAKLAVIKVEIKIATSKDLTDLVKEAMKNAKLPPEAGDLDVEHMDIDLKMDGEGELLWDVGANRAHSFELSGPSHVNLDTAMKIDAQGQSVKIEQGLEMSGTSNLSAKFE